MKKIVTRTPREVYNLWIKALKSGEYRQGTQALKGIQRGRVSYCCLGVLCDLARKDGGEGWGELIKGTGHRRYEFGEGGNTEFPPRHMLDFLKISDSEQDNLVELNDDAGASFLRISKEVQKLRDRHFPK